MAAPIKDIIKQVLQEFGIEEKVCLAFLQSKWIEILGEPLGKQCRPVKFEEGILYIETESELWRNELRRVKKQISIRFQEKLGNLSKIKDIRFLLKKQAED